MRLLHTSDWHLGRNFHGSSLLEEQAAALAKIVELAKESSVDAVVIAGEEREVSSLSGGETFQASLALALGVANTVQAHAGGVNLDALFIDEGFGTLDPDNLQLAMDELDRLREGGRMIGIISHVGGFRERVRSGIEVLASDEGSRVALRPSAPP